MYIISWTTIFFVLTVCAAIFGFMTTPSIAGDTSKVLSGVFLMGLIVSVLFSNSAPRKQHFHRLEHDIFQ